VKTHLKNRRIRRKWLKVWKKPSKTENPLPREESNPRHPNATLDAVSRLSGTGSNLLWGDFFLVFEGFFKILITFIQFYYFLNVYTPFSTKFFNDLWKFSKKKFDLSKGPFYIRKIWNTEGTEAPVWIIMLFDLSNFDLSRVDCNSIFSLWNILLKCSSDIWKVRNCFLKPSSFPK